VGKLVTLRELDWVAGLLEGEACFRWDGRNPIIWLGMTDQDVCACVAAILNTTVRGPYNPPSRRHVKPTYRVLVCGTAAVGWMMTLYSLMCSRRQAKIREVLSEWRARRPAWPKAIEKTWKRASGT
jgi:hypothetical protein